jgi:hypothetical protein
MKTPPADYKKGETKTEMPRKWAGRYGRRTQGTDLQVEEGFLETRHGYRVCAV